MKKAIIVGASSGIGQGLAHLLVQNGYMVGITGRRAHLLEKIRDSNPDGYLISIFNVQDFVQIPVYLEALVNQLGGLDLMVISAGTGEANDDLEFQKEKDSISTNITGFTAIADWSMRFFRQQGHGHLTAITSVAGLRGNRMAPAYSATKAYQIVYLEGLGHLAHKTGKPIYVTEIRAGYVDTAMAKGDHKFWVATVEKASRQIYRAIRLKKRVAYITKRWRLFGWLMKSLPGFILRRV